MFVPTQFGVEGARGNQKPPFAVVRPWTHKINGVAAGTVRVGTADMRVRFVTTETGLFVLRDEGEETGEWALRGAIRLESDMLPREFDGQRFDHFGDCDFEQDAGLLWVAVEGGGRPALFAFDAALSYVSHAHIPQKFSPWCAVRDGIVYTSEFEAGVVFGYDASGVPAGRDAPCVKMLRLPRRYSRIQGGAFDKKGRLILTVDADDAPMVAVVNPDGSLHQEIAIDRRAFGPVEDVVNAVVGDTISRDKELQGLCYRDGQLEVLLSDKNWFSKDGLILLHYTEVEEDFE